ncbi:hypothetical protein AB0E01_29150 [Nocardia vinacea]|uniref:hypothetical protein n=1 Tax=Nocardia vinacea TaxID=96468 RepID=UPI0033C36565
MFGDFVAETDQRVGMTPCLVRVQVQRLGSPVPDIEEGGCCSISESGQALDKSLNDVFEPFERRLE